MLVLRFVCVCVCAQVGIQHVEQFEKLAHVGHLLE